MKKKRIIKSVFQVLLKTGFEDGYILKVYQDEHLHVNIKIPPQKDLSDLMEILPNLKQELNCLDVKLGNVNGKYVELIFGQHDLEDVPFIPDYLNPDSLKVTLISPFGKEYVDFEDGASCHMLNGGAPRMGKTIFLLYLSTMLYVQNQGNIQLYINSPKAKDFYPFQSIKNVHIESDFENVNAALDVMIEEYKARNKLLYSDVLKKATDAKKVRELYPHMYHLFKPMFLIIDEYGRFAENQDIQSKVMELVETAGFVNVHVIIATQRPDARTVLRPRIKQGLQARICFRVPDKNNSIVILDVEGAELLPTTKGRAILSDGDKKIIQVPYLTYPQCEELLQPFRSELHVNQSETRSTDSELSNKISSLFKEPLSQTNIHGEQQPGEHNQQSNETVSNGWFMLEHTKTKR
jgi:hypothetical protein